jgi:hypothetical protein
VLPPGVSLRGAGYRKTRLDARKADVGLTIEGGEGAEVADLTISRASKTGLLVIGASGAQVRRVRTTGGLNGVNFADVKDGRIENVLSDDNRYGIVVSGGRGNAVVNCTLARNTGLALSFPSGEGTLAFNNCIAESATGVYLGAAARAIRLDHNLYYTQLVAKWSGQRGRLTLGGWQSQSGQDAHSVQLPLGFRDPEKGDYHPAGTLGWSLDRAVTADWGTADLGGIKAPESDIDRNPRAGRHDLGAFEAAPSETAARPPDGTLTVRAGDGVTSAGVFAPGGREVASLFQNLPLAEGSYPFWLPSRDEQGHPIPAGTYELRTVESALRWEYIGPVADAGDACIPSFAEPGRLFTQDGRRSLRRDETSGAWVAEAAWNVPDGLFLGDFADAATATTFGVFAVKSGQPPHESLMIVRYDGRAARPVLVLVHDPATGRYLSRADTNRDGRIDDRDGGTLVTPPPSPVAARVSRTLQPGGDIVVLDLHPERWGVIWRYGGIDRQGVPIYRLEDARTLRRHFESAGSPPRQSGVASILMGAVPDPDGVTALVYRRTSIRPTGPPDRAGTELVRFDAAGARLWDYRLPLDRGLESLQSVGPILLTGLAASCEVLAFNHDGLGLGSLGFRGEVHGPGFTLDDPGALRAYRGSDNRVYALVVDRAGGKQHVYRLEGDAIVSTENVLTLAEPAAQTLAALPSPPAPLPARPAPPTIQIPRLATPLAIDGDLAKWRAAGVAPQLIVTPESATGAIDGPQDLSAVIRLAYSGDALFLQVLAFDDVPAFPHPRSRLEHQDGIDLAINDVKFTITQSSDAGPVVVRQSLAHSNLDLVLPPDHAPRMVKVLKDARDVPERRLIESIYGVDMADRPVIVTECKLPIDATTYKDALPALFALKPGQSFRLGLQLNDSDDPTAGHQGSLVWPATYGHLNPIGEMAIAVLE